MNPYEELANAIVLLAAEDYRTALRKLKKHPQHKDALISKEEIERFFHSRWFTILTSLDGEMLLKKLQEEQK